VSEGWSRSEGAQVRRVLGVRATQQRRLRGEDVAVHDAVVERRRVGVCPFGYLEVHVRQEGVDRRLPVDLIDVKHIKRRIFPHQSFHQRPFVGRGLHSAYRPVDRSVAIVDAEFRFEGRIREHRNRQRRIAVVGAISADSLARLDAHHPVVGGVHAVPIPALIGDADRLLPVDRHDPIRIGAGPWRIVEKLHRERSVVRGAKREPVDEIVGIDPSVKSNQLSVNDGRRDDVIDACRSRRERPSRARRELDAAQTPVAVAAAGIR
jgi:hypothetical protein